MVISSFLFIKILDNVEKIFIHLFSHTYNTKINH